jgi:hypothetical protein
MAWSKEISQLVDLGPSRPSIGIERQRLVSPSLRHLALI